MCVLSIPELSSVKDPFQELEIKCPRCRDHHRARAFDLAYRADWIVECGGVRVQAVSPPPRNGYVAPELMAGIRDELQRLLAAEAKSAS